MDQQCQDSGHKGWLFCARQRYFDASISDSLEIHYTEMKYFIFIFFRNSELS